MDGTITVWDYFSNSVDVAEGQMINVYPDEPLEESTSFDVSTVEKWWSLIYSA